MKCYYRNPVKGTTRNISMTDSGKILESQKIYLPAECWEILRKLSREQWTGSSQIIEKLIMQSIHSNAK